MRRALGVLLGIALLGFSATARDAAAADAGTSFRAASLEAWQIVDRHFYDRDLNGVDWERVRGRYVPQASAAPSKEATSAVINAMLGELGSSHTRHFSPLEPAYYQLLDIFSGGDLGRRIARLFPGGQVQYTGIGIFTRDIAGRTFVSGVLDGGPAHRAGVLVGDEIVAVDGTPYHPIRSFAGRAGRPVTLTVRRQRGGATTSVAVVPARIRPNEFFFAAMRDSVRLIQREGVKIGYIRPWSYAVPQYHHYLVRELARGRLREAGALILDLRDGWGGALAEYLDVFVPNAPVVTRIGRDGRDRIENYRWRRPVVALINAGTRSGKEILAHGLKRHGLGRLVGTRTAGAVLAARAFLLSDDSLLLVAVTDVLVDGERLEGKGVAPDVEVPFPLPYAQGRDPQLAEAVRLLVAQLGQPS
jgi:carboxyl-terminal processing protease